jgi:hypothetical protein
VSPTWGDLLVPVASRYWCSGLHVSPHKLIELEAVEDFVQRCAGLGVAVDYVPTLVPGVDLPVAPVSGEVMEQLAQEVVDHPRLVSGDRDNEVLAETITTLNGQGAHINGGRPRPSRFRMSEACRPGGQLRRHILAIAQYLTANSPTPPPPGQPRVRGGRHFAASYCDENKCVCV